MASGLIIGLLLIVIGGLFTVLGAIASHKEVKGGRVGWTVWFPMLATVIGTGFTAWQLLEQRTKDKEERDQYTQALLRSNEIILQLQHADSMHLIELEEQREIGDTTCRSIGESIAELKRQSTVLYGMTDQITVQLQQAEIIHQLTRAQNYSTENVKYVVNLTIAPPGAIVPSNGVIDFYRAQDQSNARLDSATIVETTKKCATVRDTCILLLASLYNATFSVFDWTDLQMANSAYLGNFLSKQEKPKITDTWLSGMQSLSIELEASELQDMWWSPSRNRTRLLDDYGWSGGEFALFAADVTPLKLGELMITREYSVWLTRLRVENAQGYYFYWIDRPLQLEKFGEDSRMKASLPSLGKGHHLDY